MIQETRKIIDIVINLYTTQPRKILMVCSLNYQLPIDGFLLFIEQLIYCEFWQDILIVIDISVGTYIKQPTTKIHRSAIYTHIKDIVIKSDSSFVVPKLFRYYALLCRGCRSDRRFESMETHIWKTVLPTRYLFASAFVYFGFIRDIPQVCFFIMPTKRRINRPWDTTIFFSSSSFTKRGIYLAVVNRDLGWWV